MTDKVVSLNGKPLQEEEKPEPCQELVETLERMLEDAKSGELRSLLFVARISDGGTSSAYQGDYLEPLPHLTLGVLEDIKSEFLESFILSKRYIEEELE